MCRVCVLDACLVDPRTHTRYILKCQYCDKNTSDYAPATLAVFIILNACTSAWSRTISGAQHSEGDETPASNPNSMNAREMSFFSSLFLLTMKFTSICFSNSGIPNAQNFCKHFFRRWMATRTRCDSAYCDCARAHSHPTHKEPNDSNRLTLNRS